MIDLDEGRLKAWLDGELPEVEAAELAGRVERDRSARRTVEELRARELRTRELLDRLEIPPAPTARVRAAVSAARRAARPAAGPSWARRSRLAQAAALVLILAGTAAAAIPGSPVREWIERTLDRDRPRAVEPPPPVLEGRIDPDETGLVTAPDEGRVRIELVGLPAGAEIIVRLTGDQGAGVFGPVASRLELEGEVGRIHARAVAGPIRVELPRDLTAADLLVDGRLYMTKRGEALDLLVSPSDSSATEIRLRVGS